MARELTPITVRADARFVSLGARSRLIIQPSEYRGVKQIQVASQGPRFGLKDEYRDVDPNEATIEMFNVKHGVNITSDVFKALIAMGDPDDLAIEAPK